jgi:hypothetical protein
LGRNLRSKIGNILIALQRAIAIELIQVGVESLQLYFFLNRGNRARGNHLQLIVIKRTATSRASWDEEKEEFIIEKMLDRARAGKRSDSGFKKEAWKSATESFHTHFDTQLETDQDPHADGLWFIFDWYRFAHREARSSSKETTWRSKQC